MEINLLFCSVLKSSVIKRVVLMMSLNFHETQCRLNNVFLSLIIKVSVYKLYPIKKTILKQPFDPFKPLYLNIYLTPRAL